MADDGHTIDAGYVHVLTAEGGCTERCPHPDHTDAPVNVAIHHALEDPLRQWVADLGLELRHMPTPPDENAGMWSYVVVIPPDSAAARLLKPGPLDGKLAAGNRPRTRR